MPTEVNGLPAHILLLHVVIAVVPLAAALVLVAGVWPAARRWLNWLPVLASLAALIAVPITANAGRWLERHLKGEVTPAIAHHVNLGNQMLPWVAALFAASLLVWALNLVEGPPTFAIGDRQRRSLGGTSSKPIVHASTGTTPAASSAPAASAASSASASASAARSARRVPRVAAAVVAVLAVVAAAGAVQQVYRTGEAGSSAVWSGTFNS